jgi:glycosyltransferase involved in cell wall biosynthesis
MPNNTDIELSIVATIYYGERTVVDLVKAIREAVLGLKCNYEIILVDDRSGDGSWSKVCEQATQFPEVKGVRLSRNFGQQIAMSAGISYAKGKYVVIMDGDLQNPPEAIPLLYNKVKNDLDLVYTVSKIRNNAGDETTSSIFWFILRKFLGVKIVPNQLMMKIMTARLARHYLSYQEIHRTVSGIVFDLGFRYDFIEVDNRKRPVGGSHYSFLKRFNLMLDIIISMSNTPLNFMIYLGGTVFFVTLALIITYVVLFFVSDVPAGYTSLILSIFFFGSLIVMMLGFIGLYLSNIYSEVRRRPLFIEDEKVNL